MTVTPFPLQWPAGRHRCPASARKNGKFSSTRQGAHCRSHGELTVAEALKRLKEELDRIGARYPVVSTNLETRLDGLPRSGQAKPRDPGIAVYFDIGGAAHCLPCDTYNDVAQNIAAIAAHIAATRAIERHGVASVREMFRGFVALPPPQSCWEILGVPERASRETIETAYRALAKKRHPDSGGSQAAMSELNRARDEALKEL